MRLEFVADSDDEVLTAALATSEPQKVAVSDAWRPARMGLGYTVEMHREEQRKEQEKGALERKLLGVKRKPADLPTFVHPTVLDCASSDEELSKTQISAKPRTWGGPGAEIAPATGAFLSKSQKKRIRQKKNRQPPAGR